MNKTTTAVVESVDSCRSRSTKNAFVGTDFFAPVSEKAITTPYSLSSLEALDAKALEELRSFSVILIDTCVLMSPALESFLTLNATAFRSDNIKLSITPSVMMELFRNCTHSNESARQAAMCAWQLVAAPEYRDLFTTYPPSSTVTQADPNLVDAARNLKLRYEKNVLILTGDKNLTSSIFNACCSGSLAEIGGKIQVLYIDRQTAQLTRYHKTRLENLNDDVLLPEWHHVSDTSIKSWVLSYFQAAIHYGAVFMDSSALTVALSNKTPFMQNLSNQQVLRPGQKITVVTTSLRDSEIRAAVESMPHIFNIVEACHPNIREEDALLHAILDSSTTAEDLHLLLISKQEGRYEAIARRLPTCHKVKPLWGCFIDTKTGFLFKTKRGSHNATLSA